MEVKRQVAKKCRIFLEKKIKDKSKLLNFSVVECLNG